MSSTYIKKFMGKLHFTTLNYASDYILHPKLFECTVYTLNYNSCYTLHPDVSFTVKFNGNMKHVTCMCVLLKCHKLKRQKTPSFQLIKNKTSFFSLFFFFSFSFFQLLLSWVSSLSPNQKCVTLNSQIKIIFSTTTTSPLRHIYPQDRKCFTIIKGHVGSIAIVLLVPNDMWTLKFPICSRETKSTK